MTFNVVENIQYYVAVFPYSQQCLYIPQSKYCQWIDGLDVASTCTLSFQSVSLLLIYPIFLLLWNDVEWTVLSPYISRHFFPVVEARDWLSSCSLERADWFPPARWPPLICTHRVRATSGLLPTLPVLIGCVSSGSMNPIGPTTRHSNDRGRVHFNISYIWS